MAKYSVPGIRFTEIDNTIRTESQPGVGIGAIVMKSNKGPVNQRIVTSNYSEFTEIFGEPENITDYGHFAAENYFQNSTQLFAVRATMGDEQYSQIQFSYPDASITATNKSKDTCIMTCVDNQEDNKLLLLQPLSAVTIYENITANGDWDIDGDGQEGFALKQTAFYKQFDDIMSETSDIVVFKTSGEDMKNEIVVSGKHVIYPSYVDVQGNNPQLETKLLLTDEAWSGYSAVPENISITNKTGYKLSGCQYVKISVPASATMNKKQTSISFYANSAAIEKWDEEGVAYSGIFDPANFYGDFSGSWDKSCVETSGYGVQDALKATIIDWDDPTINKTYYYDAENKDAVNEGKAKQAFGLKYKEFNKADANYAIIGKRQLDESSDPDEYVVSAVSGMYIDTNKNAIFGNDEYTERSPRDIIIQLMDEYGVSDISEINDCCYLKYFDVYSQMVNEKIIKAVEAEYLDKSFEEWVGKNDYLFWYVAEKNKEKPVILPVFYANSPEFVALPIQEGYVAETENGSVALNNIVATPTSYIVNSIDKRYSDGYTVLTQTEDEPGNGDIENYVSVFDNQLVIGSIGPGLYGNDIGVSIITTACADIAALNHQNAFNWKYSYDDEDQVNKDVEDLTWKKVFRVNVYIKNKTQTVAGAWGSGMEALLKDPVESWFVSTDPYAKDLNGNSLFISNVINGHSDYIYVSRNSVNNAINSKGVYEQPNQTYSIYQLTGGKNSTKNNISEKTAALNFYKDRQRAKFDILFNCDAVDSFNGRQRFNLHQNKIAQIAGNRTMDIGVVQVTSKAAKTCKQMISEAKNFTFNNGSYVAEYAGYDKYYNSTLSSWIYLPKSVAGACAMAFCDTFAYPWMAPAGVSRGTINYTAGQLLKLYDDEIGQLYDNNVNTTRDCGAYGVVLWGQKTALKKNSLLNRINVRRCLNYIETQLENMMVPYLFMQNSSNTRSSARNDIDSFLQRVQAAEGITSYSLSVTQDPEDPTIMNVNIRLVPTSAIEFIDVKINIDRNSGVNVSEG